VIGVGVLGVPKAFKAAGPLLGSIIMVFIHVLAVITVSWLIETCSMAQGIMSMKRVLTQESASEGSIEDSASPVTAQIQRQETSWEVVFDIKKKYELTALTRLILGSFGSGIYQVSLYFVMYTTLWAYGTVFFSSFFSIFPQKLIIFAIFSCLVVPISCMELTEQWIIQVSLTAFRAFTFLAMLISSIVAIFTNPVDGESRASSPPYVAKLSAFDFSGFGLIVTTSIFSLSVQHSIPGLLQPLQDKKGALKVFSAALTTCTFLYIALGIACSLYFGNIVQDSVNLNWNNFGRVYGNHPALLVH
jgi:hypothetical protein